MYSFKYSKIVAYISGITKVLEWLKLLGSWFIIGTTIFTCSLPMYITKKCNIN